MGTAKSSSGWVGAAALGLGVLMACLEGEGEPEWSGIIRDTCGPADGPAIDIRVEEGPTTAGCPEFLMPDTVAALHRLYHDGLSLDSLKPGVTYVDSAILCPDRCHPTTHWSLTVETISQEAVTGDLRISTTVPGGGPRRERGGPVILRRCNRVHPFCG